MAATIETDECFPRPWEFGDFTLPAGEPDHGRCSGGETTPGVLGGWVCPCACHQPQPAGTSHER